MIRSRVPRVEERRDLAVEVRGQPVADVRLDQALEPVARRGVARGSSSKGFSNGCHRRERVGAERGDPVQERRDVSELGTAIAVSAILSPSVGASLASSASRSNAVSSPYAIAPSRSTTAAR